MFSTTDFASYRVGPKSKSWLCCARQETRCRLKCDSVRFGAADPETIG